MNINTKSVPILMQDRINYLKKTENGKFRFISSKHPENNYITINKTSKEIMDLVDGSNIEEIVKKLLNSYPRVSIDVLTNDVTKILYGLSRNGIIEWKDNKCPYEFVIESNDYIFNYLEEDEVINIRQSGNLKNIYNDSKIDVELELSKSFIRHSWLQYKRLYFLCSSNDVKVLIILSYNAFTEAFDVISVDVNNTLDYKKIDANELTNFLTFIKNICVTNIYNQIMKGNSIKLYFNQRNGMEFNVDKIFSGLVLEGKLLKEYGTNDILVYTLII